MIGRLHGIVLEDAEGALVVDVNGVGYELFAPVGTAGRAIRDGEGRSTFFVHTHVREDAFTLFGFAHEAERLAFRTLIGISNVGPKTALAVLSALPATELAQAIAAKDVLRLTGIPGVGKKTAERLVLELRDKLQAFPAGRDEFDTEAPTLRGAVAHKKNADLLISALTRMGYRSTEAERAITALGDQVRQAPLPELVKEALVILAK